MGEANEGAAELARCVHYLGIISGVEFQNSELRALLRAERLQRRNEVNENETDY